LGRVHKACRCRERGGIKLPVAPLLERVLEEAQLVAELRCVAPHEEELSEIRVVGNLPRGLLGQADHPRKPRIVVGEVLKEEAVYLGQGVARGDCPFDVIERLATAPCRRRLEEVRPPARRRRSRWPRPDGRVGA
jgi:hypothetical protein